MCGTRSPADSGQADRGGTIYGEGLNFNRGVVTRGHKFAANSQVHTLKTGSQVRPATGRIWPWPYSKCAWDGDYRWCADLNIANAHIFNALEFMWMRVLTRLKLYGFDKEANMIKCVASMGVRWNQKCFTTLNKIVPESTNGTFLIKRHFYDKSLKKGFQSVHPRPVGRCK